MAASSTFFPRETSLPRFDGKTHAAVQLVDCLRQRCSGNPRMEGVILRITFRQFLGNDSDGMAAFGQDWPTTVSGASNRREQKQLIAIQRRHLLDRHLTALHDQSSLSRQRNARKSKCVDSFTNMRITEIQSLHLRQVPINLNQSNINFSVR